MSQYVNFFIRSSQNEFLPIGDFSRNSQVYQAISDSLPYEKLRALSLSDIRKALSNLRDNLLHYEKMATRYKENIAAIATYNNSIEEKVAATADFYNSLDEITQEKDNIQWAISIFDSYYEILETAKYTDNINENKYLYAGIEVGEKPTINDMLENN